VRWSDERLLAVAEADHTITVRDPITGRPRWTLDPPGWSEDGSRVVASTRHGLVIESQGADVTIVRVWQPASGQVWSPVTVTMDEPGSFDLLYLPSGLECRTIPVHRRIKACFDTSFGLVVGLDMGFIVLRLQQT
jgi:hypothetical protein